MISLERCREILNKQDHKYSIEDIKEIRDYLYLLANIQTEKEKEVIN